MPGQPGNVLWMLPEHLFEPPAIWPELSQHNVPIGHGVHGEFTVGFRPNHGYSAVIFLGVDLSADHHPWTCITPGIGYPEGWQHPRVVWFDSVATTSFGVYVTEVTPVESSTWGAVKPLFE